MSDETALEKFKGLLRELFRIDLQDLDFGIYKIMRAKQKMILDFIDNELVSTVDSILNDTSEDENMRDQVFNLAYEFFSRYYSNGDFIPQVRYGGKDKYMIPYNGQEIELYWATRNAYYVKTTEYFTNYSFVTFDPLEPNRKYNISFKIKEATLEKNYVASETKFFLLDDDPIQYSDDSLNVFFNYRPLTEDESVKFEGNDNTVKEMLKKDIEENLLKLVSDELKDMLSANSNEKGIERSVIKRHLDIYFKKNESDYFIIKNLKVFLSSELENFIKNEILNFTAEFMILEKNFYLARAISKICEKIIDQISQIEDFERELWEKRKFLYDVNYVITLDRLASRDNGINLIRKLIDSKDFDRQVSEWSSLGIVSQSFSKNDLFPNTIVPSIDEKYKFLPLDTKYFKDFKFDIIELFDDLDEQLDGLLIHSENYQALNTILPKFKEEIKTIYIDPPFNKEQNADYLYNVKYKDSTWASMLENRIILAKKLLNETGSIFIRCDSNGNWIIRPLMNEIFGGDNFTNEIQVNRSKIAREGESLDRFATATDSIFYYRKNGGKHFFNPIFKIRGRDSNWIQMHSPYQYKTNIERNVLGRVMSPPKGRHWSFAQEKINRLEKEGRIRINENKTYVNIYDEEVVGIPEYLESEMAPCDSNWTDINGYSQTQGFQTENSEILLKRVIESTSKESDLVMDFFLGSGTTSAVALKLHRKFIGVEMGEHFHTIILPRMKKVLAYHKSGISKENGVRDSYNEKRAGGFLKYLELEQYEDSINNIYTNEHQFEDLSNKNLVGYILRLGMTNGNLSINRKILSDPFNFKMKIADRGVEEEVNIDLVETFNLWYGVQVTKFIPYEDDNRRYLFICGLKNNQGLIIIWRSTLSIDYNRDREFIVRILSDKIKIGTNNSTFNQVLINSDATLDLSDYNISVRSLDPIFYNMQFRDIHEE